MSGSPHAVRGALSGALLEGLAAKHLRRHGGDPESSLAALNAAPGAYRELAAIDDAEDTMTVASLAGFPATASTLPFVVQVGDEQIEVTDSSSLTWNITRGFDGTVAADHDVGTVVSYNPENLVVNGQKYFGVGVGHRG